MSRRLDAPRNVEHTGGGGVGSFLSSVAALSFGGWAALNAGPASSRSPSPPARRARRDSSGWDDSPVPDRRSGSHALTDRLRSPRIAPLDAPPPLARARSAAQAPPREVVSSPYAVRSTTAQAQHGPRLSALASPRHSAASRPSSSAARATAARRQRDDLAVRGVSRGSEHSAPTTRQSAAAHSPPFQPPAHLPAPPPTPPQRWLSPPRQNVADDASAVPHVADVPVASREATHADDLRDDCGGGAAEPPGIAMDQEDDAALDEAPPAAAAEKQLDGWALLFGSNAEVVHSRCTSEAGATQVIVDVTHRPVALLRWLRRSQLQATQTLNSTSRGASPPVLPRGTYPGRSGLPGRYGSRLVASPTVGAQTLAAADGDPASWHWLTPGQATALRLFTSPQAPHVLLLGGPGSGKSWALSAMAAAYASCARAAVPNQQQAGGSDHALRRTAPLPQSRAAGSRGSPSGAGARFVLCCAPSSCVAYRTFGAATANPPAVVMSVGAALARCATARSWLAGADAVLIDNALGPLAPQAAASLAALLAATSAARATMRRPAPVFVLAGDPGDGRGVHGAEPWGYATSCPEVASCLDLTRQRHPTAGDDTARGCCALVLTSAPGQGMFSPADTAPVAHLGSWLATAHALRNAAAPPGADSRDGTITLVDALRALLPAGASATPNNARALTLSWGPRVSTDDVAYPQRRGAVALPQPSVVLAWADGGSRQRDRGGSTQPPATSPGAKAAAAAAWDAMPAPLRRCDADGQPRHVGDVAPGDVVVACTSLTGHLTHGVGRAGAPRPKVVIPPGALGTVTAVTASPGGDVAESVTVTFHIAPPQLQPPSSGSQASSTAAPAVGLAVRRRAWTTALAHLTLRSTAQFAFSARHSVAMSGVRPGVATGLYVPLLPLAAWHVGGDPSHEDVDMASLAPLLQAWSAEGGCHVAAHSPRALGHAAGALLPAWTTSLTVREVESSEGDSQLAALAAAAAAAHRCLFGPGMDVTPVPAVAPSTHQALPPPRPAMPPVAPEVELPVPPPPLPQPLQPARAPGPAPARPTRPPALVAMPSVNDVAAATAEEDQAAALATAVRTVQLLHHLHTARSALVASLDATMSPRGTAPAQASSSRDSVPRTPRIVVEHFAPQSPAPPPQPSPPPPPTPRPAPQAQATLPPGWSPEPLAYLQAPGTSAMAINAAVQHAGPSPFDAIRAAAAAAGEEGAAAVRNLLKRAEENAASTRQR